MAIIGITPDQTIHHIFSGDPDKGNPEKETRWMLGTLDSRIMGKLKDDATSFAVDPAAPEEAVDISVNQNQLHYLACRFGLKGWSNFKDKDGNDIVFKTRKKNAVGRNYEIVDDEVLSRVPSDVIAELGSKIVGLNEVTEDEAKN